MSVCVGPPRAGCKRVCVCVCAFFSRFAASTASRPSSSSMPSPPAPATTPPAPPRPAAAAARNRARTRARRTWRRRWCRSTAPSSSSRRASLSSESSPEKGKESVSFRDGKKPPPSLKMRDTSCRDVSPPPPRPSRSSGRAVRFFRRFPLHGPRCAGGGGGGGRTRRAFAVLQGRWESNTGGGVLTDFNQF